MLSEKCSAPDGLHKCRACTQRGSTFTHFFHNRTWHFSALFIFGRKSGSCSFLVLYLIGVSSLVCVLDGGQRQCVNPGHPRVRLSHSAIHCCLVFLPASFLPSPPLASSSMFSLHAAQTLSNLCSSAGLLFLFFFLLFAAPSGKQKHVEKTATTCCSQSYLQCRSPL